MASWIPEFLAHYPAIEIELHLNDRMVGIAFERIDIALRITFTASPDLVAIPDRMQLLRNRTLLAFLREHLAAAV